MPGSNSEHTSPIRPVHSSIDIPSIFFSEATGKMFEKCLVCEKELLQSQSDYVIEKAIKRYLSLNTTDTVFEYALCLECYAKQYKRISDESRRNLENYFANNGDMMEQRYNFVLQNDFNVDTWIDRCIIKGKRNAECEEFQIMCECRGGKMLFTYSPMMISGEAVAEISERLSQKTKDDIGRFKDTYLNIPPELKINPRQPEPFLI